jgi:hypothetical protein
LWFFNNIRSYGNHQEITGLFGNRNAGDPTKWTYERDDSLTARGAAAKMIEAIRLTGQATPRNKVGFYLDYQNVCNGSAYAKGAEQCRDRGDDWVALGSVGAGFFGALAPEAGNVWDNREKITQFTWSSPATNRVLLEAGFSQFASRFGGQIPGGASPISSRCRSRARWVERRSATSPIAAGPRHRQDGREGEYQQVSPGCQQRRAVHHRQPCGDVPADDESVVDRFERQLRGGLRADEQGG